MDKRTGFKRLGIAVAGPYLAYWLIYGYIGYRMLKRGRASITDASPGQSYVDSLNMITRGDSMLTNAIIYGAAVPFAVMVVGMLAHWVYRGFKPPS